MALIQSAEPGAEELREDFYHGERGDGEDYAEETGQFAAHDDRQEDQVGCIRKT